MTKANPPAASPRAAFGSNWPAPARFLLDLFSSVRFGIAILIVLFVYSTIGSAGLFYPTGLNVLRGENWHIEFVRQWRCFELTEFEWFHTWYFNLIIGLLCANIIITTLRRIRLSWLNAGVWMIHTGIIILCVGSVVYFGTKVEGDATVIRRAVRINWTGEAGAKPVVMPALPGNRVDVPAPGGTYTFVVADINPQWPIVSEEHKGEKAYSVSIAVTKPDGERYIRQLLDGYPQYTEDVIPGKGRFKKQEESKGEAIFDKDIAMDLALEPQDRFWLKDSWAIYARSLGTKDWSQRAIKGLPRYNDYVPTENDVWAAPGEPIPVLPLSIPVAAKETNDPLRDAQVRVTGYLRYAMPQTQIVAGGGASLFPVVNLDFENKNIGGQRVNLAALDASANTAVQGLISFRWINDADALERLRNSAQRKLSIVVPGEAGADPVRHDVVISPQDLENVENAEFKDVPGLPEGRKLAYRIKGSADNLAMGEPDPASGSNTIWVLMVEFKKQDGTQFTRFVADITARTRDVTDASAGAHGMVAPDPSILTEYTPALLAPVTLVAGPADLGLRVLLNTGGALREQPLKTGDKVEVNDTLTMTVRDWSPTGRIEERPAIVPTASRDKDIDRAFLLSMVKVEITRAGKTVSRWLPFHRYSYTDDGHSDPSLGRFNPETIRFEDGREVEVLFSRESMPLPQRVALEDFRITSHVGGFEQGKMGSIRDWTSILTFEDPAASGTGGWTPGMAMSTNDPVSHNRLWYFQSFWDAPRAPRFQGDSGSAGLNYTGVGIGNREGVHTQLAGCCLSVFGMLYAFYYKPILRRRMKDKAVADAVASGRLDATGNAKHRASETLHANGHLVSQDERAGLLQDEGIARR